MKSKREEVLEKALQKIAKWHGEFPEVDVFWSNGDRMDYESYHGSNGERDYMRKVAQEALFYSEEEKEETQESGESSEYGECSLCFTKTRELKHFGIYITGSEGVQVCWKCQLSLAEIAEAIRRTALRTKKQAYKDLKKKQKNKIYNYTHSYTVKGNSFFYDNGDRFEVLNSCYFRKCHPETCPCGDKFVVTLNGKHVKDVASYQEGINYITIDRFNF